jgi:hypothetical protein
MSREDYRRPLILNGKHKSDNLKAGLEIKVNNKNDKDSWRPPIYSIDYSGFIEDLYNRMKVMSSILGFRVGRYF